MFHTYRGSFEFEYIFVAASSCSIRLTKFYFNFNVIRSVCYQNCLNGIVFALEFCKIFSKSKSVVFDIVTFVVSEKRKKSTKKIKKFIEWNGTFEVFAIVILMHKIELEFFCKQKKKKKKEDSKTFGEVFVHVSMVKLKSNKYRHTFIHMIVKLSKFHCQCNGIGWKII